MRPPTNRGFATSTTPRSQHFTACHLNDCAVVPTGMALALQLLATSEIPFLAAAFGALPASAPPCAPTATHTPIC